MTQEPHRTLISGRLFFWVALLVGSCFLVAVVLFGIFGWPDNKAVEASRPDQTAGYFVSADEGRVEPVLPKMGPLQSFATLRYAVRHGGSQEVQDAAVAWLDERIINGDRISDDQEKYLVSLLTEEGSPHWNQNYRQHLFNSIFNVLHQRKASELLLPVLLRLAGEDDDRVMRLYALQHIRVLIEADQIPGDRHAEVRDSLLAFAEDPEGELSGLALAALVSWDQQTGIEDAKVEKSHVLQVARKTAINSARPLDVRVSAIHATGPESLDAARELAMNTQEHTLVRKAAISRLGRYGGQDDLDLLSRLSSVNARLQQAVVPAINNIQRRLDGAEPSTSSRH